MALSSTISASALPTLSPSITAVSQVASVVTSAAPSLGASNPFSLDAFPKCTVQCFNQLAPVSGGDVNNIEFLCGAKFRGLTATCEVVTCSPSDYEKTQALSVPVCGSYYNANPAVSASASSSIAEATRIAAAVANRDETKTSSYPECAQKCQAAALAPSVSPCGSIANRTCVCTDQGFNASVVPCENANCGLEDGQILATLAFRLCAPINGQNLSANATFTGSSPSSTAVTYSPGNAAEGRKMDNLKVVGSLVGVLGVVVGILMI